MKSIHIDALMDFSVDFLEWSLFYRPAGAEDTFTVIIHID